MNDPSFKTLSVRCAALEVENRLLREAVLAGEIALTALRAETESAKTTEVAHDFTDACSLSELQTNGVMELPAHHAADASTLSSRSPDETAEPRSEARFWLAAIADSSDDAIVGKDLDGIITSWNKAAEATFGYSAEEIIGQRITVIIPLDRIDEEVAIFDHIRLGKRITYFETRRQRKDGTIIPVSISVSPIRDDLGRLIGVSKIARDVSLRDEHEHQLRLANAELVRMEARKTVEDELRSAKDVAERANRAKSRFLAGMSHELRTPLNGVLGYAHLLRLGGGLNGLQSAQVESMISAGTYLLQMINDVLSLTEIEAEHVKITPTEIDPSDVARSCLDFVRPSAEAKGLALRVAIASDVAHHITADPLRLRQVLLNLLSNAVKFTEHGEIELRLRPIAGALRIEVVDTGRGIPSSQRHLLFQGFERLDTEATHSVEGAGLGLALSTRLVSLMGGRCGHEENPKGGSVFWLELPLGNTMGSSAAALPVSDSSDAQPPPTTAPNRILHVLVVDDVAMNRDIAASFLRAAGHKVVSVEGGLEAVAAVATTDFDVVLMDVRMPVVDGLEATRRIRRLGGTRGNVPIVALTAQTFAEQILECRKAGMNAHLSKPFDPETLVAAAVRATVAVPNDANGPGHDAAPDAMAATSITPVSGLDQAPLARSVGQENQRKGEAIQATEDASVASETESHRAEQPAPGVDAGPLPADTPDTWERTHPHDARFWLAAIADSSDDALVGKDLNGIITSWNRAAEVLFGYSASEMIGQPITGIIPADRLDEEVLILERVRRNEKIKHFDTLRRRKDGVIIPVSISVSPIRNGHGRIIGVSKFAWNRIDRDARFWLAAIAASSNDAIVGEDLDGIVTSWNKAAEAMFGYSDTEMIGRPISRIIPPDRTDEEVSIFDSIRQRKRINHLETRRQRKDGSIIPVSISVSPIRDDLGRLIGVSKIAHDFSERDERERQLRIANAELVVSAADLVQARFTADRASLGKSKLLAEISHELRTPLNGILGHARVLQLEGGLRSAQDARVNAMVGAGKHLLDVIARVLDLSEIEAEQIKLYPTTINVRVLIAACLDLVRPAAAAKQLTLFFVSTEGVPETFVADATRLRQVLLNLLGNAVKFTERGKVEVRLLTVAEGSTIRIEVLDTGPGIPPHQRHVLFQDFERLDAGAVRKVEGAGLGLALSAHLAGAMGGRIGYDGATGGGSVFWLELPLGEVAAPTSLSGLSSGQPAPALAHSLTVLVVDDIAMNREIAKSFLDLAGHSVVCVEGGEEAVAAVATTDFDVVLMDVRMPEVDGLEATRRIRAIAGKRGEVPIVALTAHAFADLLGRGPLRLEKGLLPKPADRSA